MPRRVCFFYRVWEVHLADGRFRPDPSPYFTTKIYEMEHANAIGESVRMQAQMLCERLLTTHDARHASVQDRHANANVQTGRLVINIQTGRVDTNQEDSLLITFEVAVLALDETRDVHAATLEQCDSTYLAYAHSHFWFLASRPAIAPPTGLPRQEILILMYR